MTEQLTALELADELDRVAKWSDSEHWGTLNEAAAKLRHLHEEVTEQGRLLSMSAERELALLARIGRLEKLNAELLNAHFRFRKIKREQDAALKRSMEIMEKPND